MRGSTLALSSSRGPPSRVVWLGNTGKLTKAEIMSAMAPFGAVEEIQLKTPGATASTNSRSNVPYAFVIFAHTANAAIENHDTKELTGVSVDECKAACCEETSFTCRSFDYERDASWCALSEKSATEVGGLFFLSTARFVLCSRRSAETSPVHGNSI